MAGERRRRLVAILAADVAGYSRLVGADEEGALARLRALFREVVQPTVAAHRGRVFKLMGDAFLAEFPSAVDAVRCAADLQEAVEARGAGEPDERRIRLRVGVHLGDVVVEGGDLLGDGVNVAARLEAIAEPGGVVASGKIADEVRGGVPFALEDLGERDLKNIDRPVRAFRLRAADPAPAPMPYPQAQHPRLALPHRPSLVVLPFQNMSGDPEQEYFADGLVEDITTALSRIRWLFVIARNSAFTYKGRAADVRQVGRDLGVRYVLEGSVRRAGNRVRITGQLVEAETGHHVWATSFDGTLDDIFALQDRVTEGVAAMIEPSLQAAEIERARRKPTSSLDAYDLYLRALSDVHSMTQDGSSNALALLRRSWAIDPEFTLGKALAAFVQASRYEQGWLGPGDREEGIRLAREVLASRRDEPVALAWAGRTLGFLAQDRGATIAAAERALALNSNSAFVLAVAGWSSNYVAKPGEAASRFRRAIRLSPLDTEMNYFLSGLAYAHLMTGEYEGALATALAAVRANPGRATPHRAVVAALVCMGRHEEAVAAAVRYKEAVPEGCFVAADRVRALFDDEQFAALMIGALRSVGIPE